MIIPTPTFPLYQDDVILNGANSIFVDTEKDGFVLTADKLENVIKEHNGNVKAVIINTPGNPTGVAYTAEQLSALAEVIKKT